MIRRCITLGHVTDSRGIRDATHGRIQSSVCCVRATDPRQRVEPVGTGATAVNRVGEGAGTQARTRRGIRKQIPDGRERIAGRTVPRVRNRGHAEHRVRESILERMRHAAHRQKRGEEVVAGGEDATVTTIGARARRPPVGDQFRVGLLVDDRRRDVRGLDHDPVPDGQGVLDPVFVHVREVVAQPAGARS